MRCLTSSEIHKWLAGQGMHHQPDAAGVPEAGDFPLPSEHRSRLHLASNLADLLAKGQFVFDTTYGTEPSRLLKDARERGIAGCDGRSMLRWQGALAFRLWNGMLPPEAPMRAALGETAP